MPKLRIVGSASALLLGPGAYRLLNTELLTVLHSTLHTLLFQRVV